MPDPNRINPFGDYIVKKPRDIESPVRGLNQLQLETVLAAFNHLVGNPVRQLDKAVFLTSAQAGYGKSHILGRVFQQLSTKASLLYVLPFQDPQSCWTSLLSQTLQELGFPDRFVADEKQASSDRLSQLETLAHGIIVDAAQKALDSRQIKSADPERAKMVLACKSTAECRRSGIYKQLKPVLPALASQCKLVLPGLNASIHSWLNVLFMVADQTNLSLLETCQDWLKGGSIDLDEAKQIGIRPADLTHFDSDNAFVNAQCKNRLMDLCLLARPIRPFLFCFDETERYLHEDLARAFGVVIQTLIRDIPNHLTIITANVKPWVKIASHWQRAQLDCLGPKIELEGIEQEQARELIGNRLAQWGLDANLQNNMFADAWLETIYQARTEIGIRKMIEKCRCRWDDLNRTAPQESSIEDHYASLIETVKSEARRRVYDRDALRWLIEEVAAGVNGIDAQKYKGQKPYLVTKWRQKQRHFYFGFEDGLHWRRWKAIADNADLHFRSSEAAKCIYLRTADLTEVPPAHWKITPQIRNAQQQSLHIVNLDFDMICRLYAARDLYSQAIAGDIAFRAEEALQFIQTRLIDFWELLLAPLTDRHSSGTAGKAGTPSLELIEKIKLIVARKKLIAFDELFSQIKAQWPHEAEVRAGVSQLSEIKQYHAPNMTVLKWR